MIRRLLGLGIGVWLLVVVASCGGTHPPSQPGSPKEPNTVGETVGGVKCSAVRPQTEPELMAWDSGSRMNLNTLRRQGVVVVRYKAEGCRVELEVLANCIAKGTYAYEPYSSNGSEVISNVEELYAELPLGAARFAGKLEGNRALRADYQQVGIATLPPDAVMSADSLSDPGCATATHFVSRIYLGGFAMASGQREALEAQVTLFGAGLGGSPEGSVSREASEGNPEHCQKALSTGKEQKLCSVPLRIGLAPIDGAGQSACPDGTKWDGRGCVPNGVSAMPSTDGMVRIPAGTFTMGSNDGESDEKPPHNVTVNAFEMDKTEVTVSAYEACVRAGVCEAGLTQSPCNSGQSDKANHPINCVKWNDAGNYCRWAGKRLPTEEEWEYAARGTDGRTYPWGSAAPGGKLCWNRQETKSGTCAVGSFPKGASPFGLLDMAGNVWEWTSSGYSPDYSANRETDAFVIRGGSWVDDSPSSVRAAIRIWNGRSIRTTIMGFRCARDVPNVVAVAAAPSTDGMVRIPAGTFTMGSNDGESDEKPPHNVTVNAFEMDKTEVTVSAYEACVRAGVCTASSLCNSGKSDKANHPINCVNWNDAGNYCRWAGKRLPTEEEWEYAARGTDGRAYPWGSAAPGGKLCWNRRKTKSGTCAVGSFPKGASPFGLQDMAGNVAEWTSSGYSRDYSTSRATDQFVFLVVAGPTTICRTSVPRIAAGSSHRIGSSTWASAARCE